MPRLTSQRVPSPDNSFPVPHIRDPSVGASLVEVDKIRPHRDSCRESASLRAAEAFDRFAVSAPLTTEVQLFSRSNQAFPPLAITSNATFLHCIRVPTV